MEVFIMNSFKKFALLLAVATVSTGVLECGRHCHGRRRRRHGHCHVHHKPSCPKAHKPGCPKAKVVVVHKSDCPKAKVRPKNGVLVILPKNPASPKACSASPKAHPVKHNGHCHHHRRHCGHRRACR